MKKLLFIVFVLFTISTSAQGSNPKFDKALAEKLGADEYGMKQYVFVILKTGTNNVTDDEKRNELFRGHIENIFRLEKEGKLVVAGPFMKNEKGYRGIFIFNVKTIAEAETLLQTDPAIKEKMLEAEMFEWYGSAALGEYLEVHKKIEQKKP